MSIFCSANVFSSQRFFRNSVKRISTAGFKFKPFDSKIVVNRPCRKIACFTCNERFQVGVRVSFKQYFEYFVFESSKEAQSP
jgi:hypothetical protein